MELMLIPHALPVRRERSLLQREWDVDESRGDFRERSIVTINETSHRRGTGLPMRLFQDGGR